MHNLIEMKAEKREILRSTLYQIGMELKTNNPEASAQEIKQFLKDLIDVSV